MAKMKLLNRGHWTSPVRGDIVLRGRGETFHWGEEGRHCSEGKSGRTLKTSKQESLWNFLFFYLSCTCWCWASEYLFGDLVCFYTKAKNTEQIIGVSPYQRFPLLGGWGAEPDDQWGIHESSEKRTRRHKPPLTIHTFTGARGHLRTLYQLQISHEMKDIKHETQGRLMNQCPYTGMATTYGCSRHKKISILNKVIWNVKKKKDISFHFNGQNKILLSRMRNDSNSPAFSETQNRNSSWRPGLSTFRIKAPVWPNSLLIFHV